MERAAFYLTCGCVVSVLFSIAVSQTLMALALAALLFSGLSLRFPPFKLPLVLFFAGTVMSMLLSVDPASGRPQLRKFILFLAIPLLVCSTFRKVSEIHAVVLAWSAVGALSATRSLAQFIAKYQASRAAHAGFYDYYVGERITGFMSHWMTFSEQMMAVVLMLAALLLLGTVGRFRVIAWVVILVLLASIALGFTRSVWLGTVVGGVYLMWFWRRWALLALPLVLGIGFLVSPGFLKERIVSSFQPHGTNDSNLFRVVTRRTGIEMIKAHPWFGIGPEQVKVQFDKYVPKDIQRPLPSGWYGHLHNIYIHYAAERGIPTMLCLMWFLGKILWDLSNAARAGGDRAILHGAIAVTLAVLAVGYYELNLGDSEPLMMFLSVASFGYVAREA